MTVVLIDPLPLRRTAFSLALRPWAEENDLTLIGLDPATSDLRCHSPRMVIVNAGSRPVAASLQSPCVIELSRLTQNLRVVVMSEVELASEAAAALHAGAHGFIPLTLEAPVVLQALSYILAGGSYYPPAVLLKEERQDAPEPTGQHSPLERMKSFTSLEWLILEKLSQAKPNKAIAAELLICEATIKMHIRRIMQKLGVANRTQIALCCATWRREHEQNDGRLAEQS